MNKKTNCIFKESCRKKSYHFKTDLIFFKFLIKYLVVQMETTVFFTKENNDFQINNEKAYLAFINFET
jgi:hypothetical protein